MKKFFMLSLAIGFFAVMTPVSALEFSVQNGEDIVVESLTVNIPYDGEGTTFVFSGENPSVPADGENLFIFSEETTICGHLITS